MGAWAIKRVWWFLVIGENRRLLANKDRRGFVAEWGSVRGTSFRSQATNYTTIKVPAGTRVHAGEVGGQSGPWVGSGSQLLIQGGPQEAWKIGGGKLS